MPFRLANVLASFQAFINKVLIELVDHYYVVYIDNVLIYSRTEVEYREHIRAVYRRLTDAKLYTSLEKCEFMV